MKMICHFDPAYGAMLHRVREALGDSFTAEEYIDALPLATHKLEILISRFGDDNGERRKPYYLAELIAEEIRNIRAAKEIDYVRNNSYQAVADN